MPPARPVMDRIWEKVEIPPDSHLVLARCWIWRATTSKKRRGRRDPQILYNGVSTSVKRLVCAFYHGPPPTLWHEAGHICPEGEQQLCIRPEHLQWQSRDENEQHKRRRSPA